MEKQNESITISLLVHICICECKGDHPTVTTSNLLLELLLGEEGISIDKKAKGQFSFTAFSFL